MKPYFYSGPGVDVEVGQGEGKRWVEFLRRTMSELTDEEFEGLPDSIKADLVPLPVPRKATKKAEAEELKMKKEVVKEEEKGEKKKVKDGKSEASGEDSGQSSKRDDSKAGGSRKSK